MSAPRRIIPGRRPGGFTLIELLIALAMVALITLLLFSGLRIGSRTWERLDATAQRTDDLRLAFGFLSRTLVQARAATALYDGEIVPVFAGDAERLELAAPLSEHVGVPGIYILRLTVEGRGDSRELLLTRWLMHPDLLEGQGDIPEWEPLAEISGAGVDSLPLDADAAGGAFGRTLLLEGVQRMEISYFGVIDGDLDPDWHEEWLEQQGLPMLVRIHIETVDQQWPDLIVALPRLPT